MSERFTVLVNKKPLEFEGGPNGLSVLIHQNGLRVEVPGFLEINPKTTLAECEKLNERSWPHISTGSLFRELFRCVFPEDEGDRRTVVEIPVTHEDLLCADYAVQHISGMIIQLVSHVLDGMKVAGFSPRVFLRNPETYLHPAAEQRLMSLVEKFLPRSQAEAALASRPGKAPESEVAETIAEAEAAPQRAAARRKRKKRGAGDGGPEGEVSG